MRITAEIEVWPLQAEFRIARGTKREAAVVVAIVERDGIIGRGECTPYARYGEAPEATRDAIRAVPVAALAGVNARATLQSLLPPGAARNALDCALWDLAAKQNAKPVHVLAGLPPPQALLTAYTISLDRAEVMADRAAAVPDYPLLKLKLGGDGDPERLALVRAARPDARLLADANEAWRPDMLDGHFAAAAAAGVEVVEQPLPAAADGALADRRWPVIVCADESAHASAGLEQLTDRYGAVNIKLDKTGGLTEALAMASTARELGLKIMAGCMVATSLSMAPALLIGQGADWVDLDGPLLLARDRAPGLDYAGAQISPAAAALWG